MKYSEVKHIIRRLRIAGWKKNKGEPLYKKIWREEDLQYSQLLDFTTLKNTNVPLTHILHQFEVKAAKAFYEMG